MKPDYTHITVILDRTGSMEVIRDDTIGGFNAFLHDQQAQSGTATLTLVQFDSRDPYEVIHHFQPIAAVPDLSRATYVPRASTPLLDAIGRGINDLEAQLTQWPEAERPEQIVVAIVTDGKENASREFDKATVERMIREKQDADWQFIFLSADLSAVSEAIARGVKASAAMSHDKTAAGTASGWKAVSKQVRNYRAKISAELAFDDEDRSQQFSERQHQRPDDRPQGQG